MKKSGIWLAAIGIGIVNAALLYVFEFVGIDVTHWLWVDVFGTNNTQYRWFLVPLLAIFLSILLSALVRGLGEKRVVAVEEDLMAGAESTDIVATPRALGVVLAIGALSLLAGASLGPEASLMASATIIGLWTASALRLGSGKQIAVLASIGALLVAFLGSMIMAIVPLLLLLQKKQLKFKPAAIILLASLTSYVTILLIDGEAPGYGSAPAMPAIQGHDYWTAVLIGFVASLLALTLNWCIKRFSMYASRLEKKVPWYISAALFGLVLGALYLFGGETVEFSGSIGSHELVAQAAQYGALALVVMIVAKLLATSWSKATGYRGGLVFPSIYIGVALGLLVGELFPEFGGAGAMIGGIAGILSAVIGSPVMAAVFVLAILPPGPLLLVALCAIIGTIVFDVLKKRVVNKPTKNKARS